jgi:hypothetical protein
MVTVETATEVVATEIVPNPLPVGKSAVTGIPFRTGETSWPSLPSSRPNIPSRSRPLK